MIREIGSEFWLDNLPNETRGNVPEWLTSLGQTILTSSGRGAISLLLQQVNPQFKTVLLPSYLCESVSSPFIEYGYSCFFYEINEDLSPNIESINSYSDIGVFLHMGYFGFSTNSNLLVILNQLKEQSTIIVEDITHTFMSDSIRYKENDFYIGSIRKWFGVPTGGFIASSKYQLNKPTLNNEGFSTLRTAALLNKGEYFKTNDETLKELYLNQIYDAENLLDKDLNPYYIDNVSSELINLLNRDDLVIKRRVNFKILSEGLKSIDYLVPLFNDIENDECPMFYPILIKNRRDEIRKKLIEEKIYCPIHWPIPEQVKELNSENTFEIYNTILSIPCDQRYGANEMERIISVLKSV